MFYEPFAYAVLVLLVGAADVIVNTQSRLSWIKYVHVVFSVLTFPCHFSFEEMEVTIDEDDCKNTE